MCTERIAQCAHCGYSRNISWTPCSVTLAAQVKAVKGLWHPPHPSTCNSKTAADIKWLEPRACPTDNEGCGGIRKREEEQARERKDSGVSDMGEDEHPASGVRSAASESNWEDVAVSIDSTPDNPFRGHVWHPRGDLRKPMGPNIKYADDFVEVGPRGMRGNPRNMNLPYLLHTGTTTTATAEFIGPDIVGTGRLMGAGAAASGRKQYVFNSETSVIQPWEIRDSTEPDETYLLIKDYHTVPEVREYWAWYAEKHKAKPRPVMTMEAVVEEIFGIPQNVKK
ncbi:uncharacterized protein DNG_04834 [Cephalotrichum gorgonifer]|uniref:Uncharacterized protein n=1 Tax=Cephalotrichum gorgonifer TaxID=2041049 RepID=A0AAE8SUY2_9PEZI|nr:uncharacterized protein DNG_04834 [Cephalotrichum gorgonifer]